MAVNVLLNLSQKRALNYQTRVLSRYVSAFSNS